MISLNISPVEHRGGGRDNPYERYHLTAEQLATLNRTADASQDGLAPYAGIVSDVVRYKEPPIRSNFLGVVGDRALDADYIYFCVAPNKWGRAALSHIS